MQISYLTLEKNNGWLEENITATGEIRKRERVKQTLAERAKVRPTPDQKAMLENKRSPRRKEKSRLVSVSMYRPRFSLFPYYI